MLGDELIELSDIAPSFLFLYEQGFVRDSSAYVEGRTDSGLLIMKGPKFSLKFTLDRNQIFVDIGNQKFGWEKLEFAMIFCDENIAEEQLGSPPNIDLLGELLETNWSVIVCIYSNKSFIRKLRKFCSSKSREFILNIFNNNQFH